jgi:SulP family sulfate permease
MTTVSRLDVSDDDGERVYAVEGELFFASSNDLVYQFDYAGDPRRVVIDMTNAHVWDASTVAALDAVQHKYAARGKEVVFRGLNEDSERRLARLGGNLGAGH